MTGQFQNGGSNGGVFVADPYQLKIDTKILWQNGGL